MSYNVILIDQYTKLWNYYSSTIKLEYIQQSIVDENDDVKAFGNIKSFESRSLEHQGSYNVVLDTPLNLTISQCNLKSIIICIYKAV